MATIKITQTGSPIRRDKTQRATLVGLGLNKMHRTVEVQETPEVLGQIRKVQHLVSVERDAHAPLARRGRVDSAIGRAGQGGSAPFPSYCFAAAGPFLSR